MTELQKPEKCEDCGGEGKVFIEAGHFGGRMWECESCKGTGKANPSPPTQVKPQTIRDQINAGDELLAGEGLSDSPPTQPESVTIRVDVDVDANKARFPANYVQAALTETMVTHDPDHAIRGFHVEAAQPVPIQGERYAPQLEWQHDPNAQWRVRDNLLDEFVGLHYSDEQAAIRTANRFNELNDQAGASSKDQVVEAAELAAFQLDNIAGMAKHALPEVTAKDILAVKDNLATALNPKEANHD